MKIDLERADLSPLRGKTFVVTGGANGIGRAIVILLGEAGGNVVYGDLQLASNDPQNVKGCICNVTKWNDLLLLFETAVKFFGPIHGIVTNAGVMESSNFFSDDVDSSGRLVEPNHLVINLNLIATLNCVKIAMHFGCKDIVLIASSRAYVPVPGMGSVTYTASKYGVIGILRGLRSNPDVCVNCVSPHATDTNMIDDGGLRKTMHESKQIIQTPQTIAKAVGYHFIQQWTGKCILVMGNGYYELEEAFANSIDDWFDKEARASLGVYKGANINRLEGGLAN